MNETERIVAWLRATAEGFHLDRLNGLWEGDEDYPEHAADILDTMADSIERGDHLVWKPEPTIPVADWIDKPSVGH